MLVASARWWIGLALALLLCAPSDGLAQEEDEEDDGVINFSDLPDADDSDSDSDAGDESDDESDDDDDEPVAEPEPEPEPAPEPESPAPVVAATPAAAPPTPASAATSGDVPDGDKSDEAGDDDEPDRFRFGSYGRVQVASDLEGGLGGPTRIVFPAPRVDEGSYAEIELGYLAYRDESGVEVDTVFTLALDDDFFHFDSEFASSIAIRNLFAEARHLFFEGSYLWVGSRMVRGDDVYLLDTWPLDNLNTWGAGLGWRGESTRIGLHTGVNRLDDEYQFQVVSVADERFVGAREVVFMDRLRVISSLKAEQLFGGRDGDVGFKIKVYGETHALPEGTLRRDQPREEETLPSDFGWTAGLQLGTWNLLNERSFVNLFFRISGGLAAYGETAIPFGINDEKTAAGALNVMTALSANIETDWFGVLVGGFVRYFQDADGFDEDFDDGVDAAWSIRPMAFIGDYFTPGFEVSQQLRRPNGVNPTTNLQELGTIWKISVLPAVTFGEGMYARPQIRLNYTVSILDGAAQSFFPIDDRRRSNEVIHFLGVAAEWWFNSSSYQ